MVLYQCILPPSYPKRIQKEFKAAAQEYQQLSSWVETQLWDFMILMQHGYFVLQNNWSY